MKSKYQTTEISQAGKESQELGNLQIRYKDPQGGSSQLLTFPIAQQSIPLAQASDDFRFASAVAWLGLLVTYPFDFEEQNKSKVLQNIIALAEKSKGKDEEGYRKGFIDILAKIKK